LEYEKDAITGKKERKYVWNNENSLIEVHFFDSSELLTQKIHFEYDDQNTRIARRSEDDEGQTISRARYLTDYGNPTGMSQILAEIDPTSEEVTRCPYQEIYPTEQ